MKNPYSVYNGEVVTVCLVSGHELVGTASFDEQGFICLHHPMEVIGDPSDPQKALLRSWIFTRGQDSTLISNNLLLTVVRTDVQAEENWKELVKKNAASRIREATKGISQDRPH